MIVFDTETTGLLETLVTPLERQPQIIEFAAIKLDDLTFEIIDKIEFLCNPGKKLDDKIKKITRLTDEMLEDKPAFGFYYDRVKDFFANEKTMVAHNVMFDLSLLKFELERINKLDDFPMPEVKICTAMMSMSLRGYRMKLSDYYFALCNKKIKDAHRAMNDVIALVECVQKLHQQNKIKI